MITSSAPAKIILFGEHAVVHGRPALAIPFHALRARVEVARSAPALELRSADGRLLASRNAAAEKALPLQNLLDGILRQLRVTAPAVTLCLSSDIPPGGGLGSGAAISAALTRALARATAIPLDNERLNRIVFETEKGFHGTPSGIDNTVVVHEQALCFLRGQPPLPVRVARPLRLLVADSGQRCATRIPVGAVREQLQRDPEGTAARLDAIGQVVRQALVALADGEADLAGQLMNRNQALLRRLDVSSEPLDRLVGAARAAGAYGAKLSGAGRGGHVIALVDETTEPAVASALQAAGATSVRATTIPQTDHATPGCAAAGQARRRPRPAPPARPRQRQDSPARARAGPGRAP